jgi:3-methylfumaryl-CoA hydratase
VVRHSQIGPDGHPRRGDFLPPVPLPRRMFGGKRVSFVEPLRVGDEVRRESVIQAVNIKEGRTGRMVFVTVKTDILSPRGLAITEEQDIIYRGEPDPKAPPPPPQPVPGKAVWRHEMTADPVLLFRYSALTFNGHRIHYDWRYVTQVEGYPDLIVNGGLQTLLVFELVRTHASTPLAYISSRNVRPLFVNRPFTVCGEPSPDNKTAKLWVADQDGAPTLIAEAEFR